MRRLQQGDVILKQISKIPERAKKVSGNVLAEGEHTGHFHALCQKKVGFARQEKVRGLSFFKDDKGNSFVKLTEPLELLHQEHNPISVSPGVYEIGIVKEYDHFAEGARNVAD